LPASQLITLLFASLSAYYSTFYQPLSLLLRHFYVLFSSSGYFYTFMSRPVFSAMFFMPLPADLLLCFLPAAQPFSLSLCQPLSLFH